MGAYGKDEEKQKRIWEETNAMLGEDRTSLPAGLRGLWSLLKLCRGWASVMTGLSDHCFGYKTEYKPKRLWGELQGGEEVAQTYCEEKATAGLSVYSFWVLVTVLGAELPLPKAREGTRG